jgi:molybdenum cofactor synthesis domain-containing protein
LSSRQKRALKLIRLEDARRRIAQSVANQHLRTEEIDSTRSLGRVLIEDIVSDTNLPDHDQAAMDGFAVKTENLVGVSEKKPIRLTVKGEIYPSDHPTDASIRDGEAMYVACGAPIPKGADAVLKIEDAGQDVESIVVQTPLEPHANVFQRGEDMREHEVAIPKGRLIRPQDIGLLLALNKEKVKVIRKSRVAIISVGDELTEPFSKAVNKTVNNSAYIVAALIESFNAKPLLMGIARDTPEEISRKINKAIELADIIITIAGCSVGLKDYVPDVIENLADDGIVFHGVALSAGKVSGFGLVQGTPAVMLPGHIGSTVAAFYLLVLPLLNSQQGLGFEDHLPTMRCTLEEPIRAGKSRIERVLTMKVHWNRGIYRAAPMKKPLSALKNLADANGFALIPSGKTMEAGDLLDVRLYGSIEFYALGK